MTRFLPLLIIVSMATSALAEPGANDWLRVGLERYERGNLVGAIEAFERGYAIEPRPMFLFALGQAHRKRGDCERARASFDAYLATSPAEAQAAAALDQRERCEPPEPATVAAPAPAPAPPPAPSPSPPPPAPRSPPWWSDRLAVGAGGAGVLLLGAGAGLWLSSSSAADDAAAATTYDEHQRLRERAESRRRYAGVALGAGAAAAAVTVWRLTRDRGEHATVVAPAVTADGAGVVLGGTF